MTRRLDYNQLADLFAAAWAENAELPTERRLPETLRDVFDAAGVLRYRKGPASMVEALQVSASVRFAMRIVIRYCDSRDVDYRLVIAPDKRPLACDMRSEIAWLLRQQKFSFPVIGAALGGRDHSTVMSAVRRCEARIAARPEYEGEIRGAGERRTERGTAA